MKFRIDDIALPSQTEVAKLFECSICLNVIHNPVQTKCGHVFCGECLENTRNRLCPVCKIENDAEDIKLLKDVNIPMYRMMGKIPVRCPFWTTSEPLAEDEPAAKRQRAVDLCTWTGAYADLLEVHLGECLHALVECPHCNLQVARRNLAAHEDKCEQRYQLCSICGERMRSEEEHMQKFALSHVTILQSQLREAQRHSATEATILPALSAVRGEVSDLQLDVTRCAKSSTMKREFSELKSRSFSCPWVGEKFTFVVKGIAKLMRDYPKGSGWKSPVDIPMGFRISLYPNGNAAKMLETYSFYVATVGIPRCFRYDLSVKVGTTEKFLSGVCSQPIGHSDFGRKSQLVVDARDDALTIVLTVNSTTRAIEIAV